MITSQRKILSKPPKLFFNLVIFILISSSCKVTNFSTNLDFKAPWSLDGMQATECSLLSDMDSLYFDFTVADTSLVALSQDNFHQGIGVSDRVEIFFTQDSLMSKYYGMELCFDSRVLDFAGESYRQIDFDWSWPKSAFSKTCIVTDVGYQCKGAFSLSYLKSIGLIQNNQLNIGVFRADYHSATDSQDVTWITVKDPDVPNPDFHIYSAFFRYSLK